MLKIITAQMYSLLIIILFILQPAYAQHSFPSDSLTALLTSKENEMFSIITNGNKEAAEELIARDYVTINADGVMEGKENTIKTIQKFKGSTFRLSDKKIRVYNDIAIINGRAKFYLKAVLVAEIFYTEVWNFRNGEWQFISWQGTMTGLPSHYPVIVTIIIILLLYLAFRLFRRKRKMIKLRASIAAGSV